MRIRKNATRVIEGKKRSSSSYLICQLNRPPWYDDSFFTQGYWDNDLPLNGSSSSNASLHPTSHSEESMDISEKENGSGGIGADECNDSPAMLPEPAPPSTVLPKKRGRPRKSTLGLSVGNDKGSNNYYDDNPYEFYYYSGFGPSWSKRRGQSKFNSVTQMDSGNSNSDDNNIMVDDEKNNNGNGSESFKSVIDAQRELDYIEEDEEEEWYGGGRARKPIKARSLKSIM